MLHVMKVDITRADMPTRLPRAPIPPQRQEAVRWVEKGVRGNLHPVRILPERGVQIVAALPDLLHLRIPFLKPPLVLLFTLINEVERYHGLIVQPDEPRLLPSLLPEIIQKAGPGTRELKLMLEAETVAGVPLQPECVRGAAGT